MSRDLDRYAADYTRDYGFERWQVEYRRRVVLTETAGMRSGSVLEVGCGLEPLFCAEPDSHRWLVVEPSTAFVAAAQVRAQNRQDVQIIEGFLESSLDAIVAANNNEAFSLIIVSGLLQEVNDPQLFLAAVRTLCSDETVVHVNVPNAHSLHRRTAVAMGLLSHANEQSHRAAVLQQRTVYDVDSLYREVVDAGFRVVGSGGILLKPFEHHRMLSAMETGILTEAHLDAYAVLGAQHPDLASEIWVHLQVNTGR